MEPLAKGVKIILRGIIKGWLTGDDEFVGLGCAGPKAVLKELPQRLTNASAGGAADLDLIKHQLRTAFGDQVHTSADAIIVLA